MSKERTKAKLARAAALVAVAATASACEQRSPTEQQETPFSTKPFVTQPTEPVARGVIAEPAGQSEVLARPENAAELNDQLANAKRAGELISKIDPSKHTSEFPKLSELGIESRDWWLLESQGFLVTKATFLGSVEEKIVGANGEVLGRVLLLGFTREEGKVLWVAGPVEFLDTSLPLRLLSDDAPEETWPNEPLSIEQAKEELSVGDTYILDIWYPNPWQGWEQFEGPEDILDFFDKGGYPKGEEVRRQTLETFLIPASFAAGFGTEYTSDNVRSGNVSSERILSLNHLLKEDTTLLEIPFK